MEDLKPCPFCGGKPRHEDTGSWSSVGCEPCDFYIEKRTGQEVAAWNRREAPLQHDVDAQIAQNAVNALRYRWLRMRHIDAGQVEVPEVKVWPNGKCYKRIFGYGADLDNIVDDEIRKTGFA